MGGVHVGIDQSREPHLALQIDLVGSRSGEARGLSLAAHGHDAAGANGDGLGHSELRVHGNDFAVVENQVGGPAVRYGHAERQGRQ